MSRLDKDHMTHIPQVPRHRSNASSATSESASDPWLAIPDFTLVAEVGSCPTIAAQSDAVAAHIAETPSVATSNSVVGMDTALDAPMLASASVASSSEISDTSPSSWPLDASIQVHPERPGLKPVLANLGSYTGLVGHLVRMSTSDWRRTVVILGVGMLAILSWMRGGSSPKAQTKLASPQMTGVPDVSSIEQLGQEPLRATTAAKKPPALPTRSAIEPAVASRPTPVKVEDDDLFRVKSLEVSGGSGRDERESSSADADSAKPDWPDFKAPSGSKISRFMKDRSEAEAGEPQAERVAQRERGSRWGRLSRESEATEVSREEESEEQDVRVVAQRRSSSKPEEYPSTDAEEYPPYEMPTAARRSGRWSR